MRNPFGPSESRIQKPHRKQIAFEGERVRMILRAFGLSESEEDLRVHYKETMGEFWLTFESFYECYPSFPILLEARSLFNTRSLALVDMFRNFRRTFVGQRYFELFERGTYEAKGRPIGMVFPFVGFRGGLIAHNCRTTTQGFRCAYDVPHDAPPHRVVVEPFQPFVDLLARSGWTPKKPLPRRKRLHTQQPTMTARYYFEPWMVHACGGSGGDAVLLAFLVHALRTKLPYGQQFVRVLDGVPQVAVTHDELAMQTGMTLRQVSRAIASLRKNQFVQTTTRDYGGLRTHFVLNRQRVRRAKKQFCDWRDEESSRQDTPD